MVKRLSPITVQDAYNVTAYGAKGDGSTNDTTAIQATIDAAYGAGGAVVYLPTGTYIVNPGIQVKDNVTFRGAGGGTILKLVASSTTDDNILKSESYDNVTIEELIVDGNRTNQAGSPGSYTHTQYGIYIAGSGKITVRNVGVKSTTGVGIHIYNASATTVEDCYSTDNNYHGFEVEQCIGSKFGNIYGFDNLLHGLLVSPGEVSGTGSKYNHFVNCHFDSNDQYGIAFNAANSDVSPWLSEGNQFTNCSATNNAQYGVNIYKQDRQIFTNLLVEANGYHGIYCYQSADNIWNNIYLRNNSQTTTNTYDEILLEGASGSHASAGNLFSSVKVIVEATNKARYALHEDAAGDNNTWLEVSILGTPATANTNLSSSSRYGHVDLTSDQTAIGGNKIFTTGFGVAANSVTPTAALAGLDAPFGSTSPGRILSKYGMQLVTSNGAFDIYVSDGTTQNNVATFYNDHLDMRAFKITDMADPTSAQDAATKAYVDTGYRPGGTDVAVADGGTGASTASGARTNLGLAIGTNVQAWDADLDTWATKTAPSGTVVGTSDTQTLTSKDLTSGTNTFPTFNQNTTGSAATLTTSRTIGTLTGDVTSAGSSFNGSANNTNSTTVTRINGTSLAGLATGILKNTTSTGVPSIAVAADFPTLNQNTTGSAATLTTGRTVQTNLASTSSATFNGSANITPGVTGTLPVGNGGTGATTITGLVKGNGTSAMTAATAGTDYLGFSGTSKVSVGTSQPGSPSVGDLWVDTN